MFIRKLLQSLFAWCAIVWTAKAVAHPDEFPRLAQVTRESVPVSEKALSFGSVYLAQWVFYYASQRSIIDEHGSFQNMLEYPLKPHFDKDHFNYNVFKHTLTGQYYYLFYRSRGYDVQDSFLWATASSLAFEFAVETMTEPPSIQDIYQTPVFGTAVGMGVEKLSLYLLSLKTPATTFLGRILNPFSLLPNASYGVSLMPMISNGSSGVLVSLEY